MLHDVSLFIHVLQLKCIPGCSAIVLLIIEDWKQASSIDFSLLRSLDLTSPVYGDHVEAESICTTTGALQVRCAQQLLRDFT